METKINKINIKGKEYFFDYNLKGNLDNIIKMIELKFDGVLLIDGMEGSGKSELGKQMCIYMDKNFSDEDVIYTVEQFENWLKTTKPGKACLWDEFVLAGLSTEALSKMQNTVIKNFTLIRKKRLFICLVIPYIFMLRKYFAVARTRALIHVYTKGMNRGYFKFYNYNSKQAIYNYGHKTWMYYKSIKPNFEGKFQAWSDELIDDDKIEQKKDQAILDLEGKDGEEKHGTILQRYRSALIITIKELRKMGMKRHESVDLLSNTLSIAQIEKLYGNKKE